MSAIGTQRTSASAPHMSAFGVEADTRDVTLPSRSDDCRFCQIDWTLVQLHKDTEPVRIKSFRRIVPFFARNVPRIEGILQ